MKLKVMIVDDEVLGRRNLELLLAREPDIRVVASCDRAEGVMREVVTHRPDLIFLDIQMPGMNGLELMASLKQKVRPTPIVIFVTAHERYAVQAFGLHAHDYLLKPFSDQRLREAVMHARARILQLRELDQRALPVQPGQPQVIVIKERGNILQLSLAELCWVESADHYLVLHTLEHRHIWRSSLREFLSDQGRRHFLKIHRSAAVNRQHVARLFRDRQDRSWVELAHGQKLRVSRRQYPSVAQGLTASVEDV